MEIKVLLMQNYELGHREIFTISEALDGKVNGIQFDNYVIDELESVLHAIFRKNILFCTDTPTEVTAKSYEDNPYISDKLKEELMRRVENYEY